jgi:hypothetical protein
MTHPAQRILSNGISGFAVKIPIYTERSGNLEARFLDLLDSGRPLTISAENRSYVLPAVNVPNWKKRFKERCG